MRHLLAASACGLVCLMVVGACGDGAADDASGATGSTTGSGGAGGQPELVGVTTGGPPPPEAELCGNEVHDVGFDAPALYFVLDASGSMVEIEGDQTRYEALRDAVVDLVGRLGDRARVGAAIFPHEATQQQPCRPGDEVFAVKLGDPVQDDGGMGPTTSAFAAAIDVLPNGGTPTAVTLEAVRRALLPVPGQRAVVLVTDGGPNCNEDAECGAASCVVNMADECPGTFVNCCDPSVGGTALNCLDRGRTLEAVSALRETGVPVHVIGIAGSGPFSATLGQMALLGGAPTTAPPYYYEAGDVDSLGDALASVAQVVGSCVFALDTAPPETWRTNVWLDAERLDYDPANGWMWLGAPVDYVPTPPPSPASAATSTASGLGGAGGLGGASGLGGAGGVGGAGGGPEVDTSSVELRGEACRRFTSGEVRRVQIVTGCPTTTPN